MKSIINRFLSRRLLALFTFSLIFIGAWILYAGTLSSISEYYQIQNWQKTSARVLESGVDINNSDTTIYQVFANYEYTVNGITYQNNRIAINDVADSNSDFHQKLGDMLSAAQNNNQLIPVWFNPDEPDQAVLNRDLRWELIVFYTIFSLGIGGAGMGILYFRFIRPTTQDFSGEPNTLETQPWLARSEWQNGIIKSNDNKDVWIALGFTVFWNLIAIPAAIVVTPLVFEGEYGLLLVYLFPAIGLLLIIWATAATLRRLRFGNIHLRMTPFPGTIGGQVGGHLTIPLQFNSTHAFKTTLQCCHSSVTGVGKSRSRNEQVVWQADGYAYTSPVAQGTRLNIMFKIDDNLPISESKSAATYHLWRLHVACQLPGVDFFHTFEIPVFQTNVETSTIKELSTQHPNASHYQVKEIEQVLNLSNISDGIQITYPAFKKAGVKIVGSLFGLTFLTAGVAMGVQGAPFYLPLVFTGIGTPVALLFLYSLVVSIQIRIDSQYLVRKASIFSISIGKKQVPRSDITSLRVRESSRANNRSNYKPSFSVQVNLRDGGKITIGFDFLSRSVAEQFMTSVSTLTGIPEEL